MLSIESTIRRCAHGVYIGKKDERALYCQICTPGGPAETRAIVISRFSDQLLNINDAGMRANNRQPGTCPACGCTLYIRQKETGGDARRECAECGELYTSKAKANHHGE